jgi:hypothetical protein
MDGRFYGYGIGSLRTSTDIDSECVLESTRVKTWFENRSSTDVLVYRAMDSFGWKLKFVSGNSERSTWVYTVDGEDIRSSGLEQASDGLHAEVPLWCASGPIARRWIVPTCLEAFWLQEWEWVLEDCHKRSCWKNSIGMSVPVPCSSDVYMCSMSCWLCLTVVYWLLECNKVPSWIEPPSTLQYANDHHLDAWIYMDFQDDFSVFHQFGYSCYLSSLSKTLICGVSDIWIAARTL